MSRKQEWSFEGTIANLPGQIGVYKPAKCNTRRSSGTDNVLVTKACDRGIPRDSLVVTRKYLAIEMGNIDMVGFIIIEPTHEWSSFPPLPTSHHTPPSVSRRPK